MIHFALFAQGALSLNVNESYSVRIVQLTKAESGSVLPMLCEHVVSPTTYR